MGQTWTRLDLDRNEWRKYAEKGDQAMASMIDQLIFRAVSWSHHRIILSKLTYIRKAILVPILDQLKHKLTGSTMEILF